MKILFISEGGKSDEIFSGAIEEYTKRLNRYFETEWKLVASLSDEIKKENSKSIFKDGDFIIALDETGRGLSTEELSDYLSKRIMSGVKRIIFVIGGSYGLPAELKNKANFIWSLSKLTFPHQLARLILAESVYRAISFSKGEPYHHK